MHIFRAHLQDTHHPPPGVGAPSQTSTPTAEGVPEGEEVRSPLQHLLQFPSGRLQVPVLTLMFPRPPCSAVTMVPSVLLDFTLSHQQNPLRVQSQRTHASIQALAPLNFIHLLSLDTQNNWIRCSWKDPWFQFLHTW